MLRHIGQTQVGVTVHLSATTEHTVSETQRSLVPVPDSVLYKRNSDNFKNPRGHTHLSFLLLHFRRQELDQRRLPGTVGPDDGNAGAQAHVEGDVGEGLLGGPGVGEPGLDHLQDGLLAAGHPVQRGRLRELEAERRGAQLVVGLGLGFDLGRREQGCI